VISELFSPVAGLLNYSVVMEGQRLVPLLLVQPAVKTTTSAAVVGGYVRIGDGLVVFVPAGQGPGQPYWLALAQLPSLLRRDKPEFPEWVDKFQTAAEVTAFDNIAAQKEQIKRLQAETAKLEIQTSDGRRLKQLFVGSGSNFEDAVAEALRELGLSVVPGPHPRADLLATDGKRIAAIEAKGIDGASREEHVRQVMMWMPDVDAAMSTALSGQIGDVDLGRYVEQLKLLPTDQLDRSSDCKGILVIGTFRKLPLDQRAQQPDFPENVVRVIARQDVCALTGRCMAS
jgi:hypothetical protein